MKTSMEEAEDKLMKMERMKTKKWKAMATHPGCNVLRAEILSLMLF